MALVLCPRQKRECSNGKASFYQRGVSWHYFCFSSLTIVSTSFVIRNALQWLKSPVGQPGDTALAAYVVRIHLS
jgi:hypothetical protein